MPLSNYKPEQYSSLLEQKTTDYLQLFTEFDFPQPEVFPSPVNHFRMRAEFRVWHDADELNYVMFKPEQPKVPVAIEQFPIASKAITSLMPVLKSALKDNPILRRKLFQVEFLSTTTDEMLVSLLYHRQLDENWQAEANKLAETLNIDIIGRARKQKFVIGKDFVTEELTIAGTKYSYQQHENSFTQPNAAINAQMITWAMDCCENAKGDLLELYCGNGNFTLPLAKQFNQVVATEISKTSVAAAQHNMAANNVENITMLRMSSEDFTSAWNKEREFRRLKDINLNDFMLNTILVDPPRAGLDEATIKLAQRFDNIVYISCNPATLQDNLKTISKTHNVIKTAIFDQFPYTHHIESGVLLQRK